MFNNQEIAEKALLRAELLRKERAARKASSKALISIAGSLALIIAFALFIPSVVSFSETATVPNLYSGALLSGGIASGGYIIAGVFGFCIGAAITFYLMKRQIKSEKLEPREKI